MSFDLFNSSSKVNFKINDPSIGNNVNPLLSYYYCPKCFKLPSIKLSKEYVEIECTCYTKNEEKIQLPNEDITNPEVLLDIVQYKKYKLLLKSYIQLIQLNSKNKKICEQKINHSDERKAEVYCANCDNLPFMCDSCLSMHDKFSKSHKKIKSVGIKLSEICENKECKDKFKSQFYCKDCKLHLCIQCESKHKNHSIINLESFIQQNKNILKKDINSNSFIDTIKLLLQNIQKAINESNELIKKHIELNNDYYLFNDSLYNTYECSKDIMNYHSINNILINNIDNILKNSNTQLFNNIQSLFTNSFNQFNQLKSQFNQIQFSDFSENLNIPSFNKDPNHLNIQTTISNNTNNYVGGNLIALYTLDNKNYELAHSTSTGIFFSKEFNIEIIELNTYTTKYTIKSAHSRVITAVKHYYNKFNNNHYLISSAYDKSVKVWNINNNYSNTLNISNATSNDYWYPLFMVFNNNNNILIGAEMEILKKLKCIMILVDK